MPPHSDLRWSPRSPSFGVGDEGVADLSLTLDFYVVDCARANACGLALCKSFNSDQQGFVFPGNDISDSIVLLLDKQTALNPTAFVPYMH